MSFEPGGLLDLLYEATLEPALWSAALNRLADEVGGHGNVLTRINIWDGAGTSLSNRRDPVVMKEYFEHWSVRNPLHQVADPGTYRRAWRPMILVDDQLIDKSALTTTGFYNDWMRPNGMHSVMMIRLALDEEELSVINISRPENKGRYSDQDLRKAAAYHPHIVRAFALAQRLSRASQSSDDLDIALDQLGLSVFMVGPEGRLRHLNRSAEQLLRLSNLLSVKNGELHARDATADRQLIALIQAAAARGSEGRRGGKLTLSSHQSAESLSLTVSPVTSSRVSIFSPGPSVMICASRLDADPTASERLLREVHGLTPAEAKLAVGLAGGSSLAEIARKSNRSPNTVRFQLSSIFEKLAIHRQVDLVRVVAALER